MLFTMLSKVAKRRLAKRIAGRLREKLTPKQREEMVARYANDERAADLAREYGVSQFTVYKWIRVEAERAKRASQ